MSLHERRRSKKTVKYWNVYFTTIYDVQVAAKNKDEAIKKAKKLRCDEGDVLVEVSLTHEE